MPFEPDRILLRRYHAAMARGDRTAALEAWEQLGLNNFDRIKQSVKVFRYSAASKGIDVTEQGSAVSEAWLRVQAMGNAFRKQEIEAYYAALRETVFNACRDFGRKEFRHTKQAGGSLDDRFDPESEAGPYELALNAWEAERRRATEDKIIDELQKQRAESFVRWGIGQVKNDTNREVLELTFNDKLKVPEIAMRLETSTANVYQRRCRGLKELEKILREHGS